MNSLFFAILIFTVSGYAAQERGGGNAVVCKNQNGAIKSVEFLDLYEARTVLKLQIPPSNLSVLKQATDAATKIGAGNAISSNSLIQKINDINSILNILPKGAGLIPIPDSDGIVLPKECGIVQIARYESNETINIDGDLWEKLDSQNRAALLTHEALYWWMRLYGETTSKLTRNAIGVAFAGTLLLNVYDIPEDATNLLRCFTGNSDASLPTYSFIAYQNASNSLLTFQFLTFDGHLMLSKATITASFSSWPNPPKNSFFYSKLSTSINQGLNVNTLVSIKPKVGGGTEYLIGTTDGGLSLPKQEFTCVTYH